MTHLESAILDTGGVIKKKYTALISNVGKAVALITLTVAALVTFTDIGFGSPTAESFSSSLLIMLIASYVIYFSLESSGERLGEESEEYASAISRFRALSASIAGDMIPRFREFVENYLREELEYRRKMRLFSIGSSEEELDAYLAGGQIPKKRARELKRISRMRVAEISPASLLSLSRSGKSSELTSPEGTKLMRMLLSLIPSTVCTCVTVSVMLSAKTGLDFAAIISGLLKLSSLVIIGARGFSSGYFHVKEEISAWINAKCRLIDSFLQNETAA